jgi:hypothetical protein
MAYCPLRNRSDSASQYYSRIDCSFEYRYPLYLFSVLIMTLTQNKKILHSLKLFISTMLLLPLSLLWGEGFTRVFLPQNVDSKMNIYESDSVIGYKYKPNAFAYEKGREYNALYQINSLGIRDREYGPKKPAIFRILLLGDSFSVSHGLPIEESLSRQLEGQLQENATHDRMPLMFEVVNAAVGGYSPYNYWKAYIRWAPVLKPDLVVLGLSPDDYDSSNEELIYIIQDGMRVASFREGHAPQERGEGGIRKLRKWLSWNSEFYILLRNFFYYNDLRDQITVLFNDKKEARTNQLQQYMVPQPDEMVRHWRRSLAYVEKLHKSTSADNVPLVIIAIPLKEEIDGKVLQRTLMASGLNPSQIDINQPLSQISSFGNERNIPLLDPRPILKLRHLELPCYFIYDGHWQTEGVKYAANYIAKQWRKSELPPWDKKQKRLQ